ncbi:MAG: hypothetical protein FJ104_11400, partial [Deltaproteobacteria bacterium]|nr:hypothetical protein [Deltaproteobacteria bacterium]
CGSADGQVVAFLDEEALVTSALPLSVVDVSGSPSELGELVRLAARLPDSRIVTDRLTGPLAAALVEATASGAQGICAVQIAPTARRALAALPGLIAAARPGLPVDVAREWVSATFDLVIEVAVLRDGRQRVVRVAEPAAVVDGEIALRDIFVFQVERTAAGGAVEGTFQATGTSPRLVAEMSARGVQLDSGVFSRPASR